MAKNSIKGDTISAMIWELSKNLWVVPFFFGALCSHLFFPRNKSLVKTPGSVVVFWTIPSLLFINGWLILFGLTSPILSPIALSIGVVFGWLLWPNLGKQGA